MNSWTCSTLWIINVCESSIQMAQFVWLIHVVAYCKFLENLLKMNKELRTRTYYWIWQESLLENGLVGNFSSLIEREYRCCGFAGVASAIQNCKVHSWLHPCFTCLSAKTLSIGTPIYYSLYTQFYKSTIDYLTSIPIHLHSIRKEDRSF